MKPVLNKLIFLLIFIFSAPSFCQQWSKSIVPGINYTHFKRSINGNHLHVHLLKIDLKNSKIKIRPQLAKGVIGSLEKTSDIAYRTNAVAAINGSFFETRKKLHLPVGLMIIDGQVVSKSILDRAAFGIKDNKEVVMGIPKTKGYIINKENNKSVPIWGVNRPRKTNEVIIYTNEYGERTGTNNFGKEFIVNEDGKVVEITNGNSRIPDNGYVVSLHGWSRDFIKKSKVGDRIGLTYELAQQWDGVKEAVTGGPLLIKEGEIVHKESIVNEKFRESMLPANSRTAIGVTRNNELIFVVVDKQQNISMGMTYDEVSEIMKEFGAYYAIGMDGGHTSTMFLNGKVVNYPLRKYESEVSNAIIVTYDGFKLAARPKAVTVYKVAYKPPSEELIAALKEGAQLTPTTYIPRQEDFGMYGLYDLYNRVLKPVIPSALQSSFSP